MLNGDIKKVLLKSFVNLVISYISLIFISCILKSKYNHVTYQIYEQICFLRADGAERRTRIFDNNFRSAGNTVRYREQENVDVYQEERCLS